MVEVIRDDGTVERINADTYYYHGNMVDLVLVAWDNVNMRKQYKTVISFNINTIRELYKLEQNNVK